MNFNKVALVVLVILAGLAIYVYTQKGSGTIKQELSNFAVADTASINKIFLANKDGQQILLDRTDGEWTLNGDFKPRKDLLNVLMETIARVEMKAPVAKSAHNNMVRQLAGRSTKVEIYQNGKLNKVYFVGGSTKDNLGTYMLLDDSSVPFITHIPGFAGYLTPRYTTLLTEWRDTEIFSNRLNTIRQVEMYYHELPEESFTINRSETNNYEVLIGEDQERLENLDSIEVRRYLLNFKNLRYEAIDVRPEISADSVFAGKPFFTLSLTDTEGTKTTLEGWRMTPRKPKPGEEPLPSEFDIDRMHARLNGANDLLLIQYFVFDRVLIQPQKFEVDPLLHRQELSDK